MNTQTILEMSRAAISGMPIVIDRYELEAFFVERKRPARRGSMRRHYFSYMLLRRRLQRKIIDVLWECHLWWRYQNGEDFRERLTGLRCVISRNDPRFPGRHVIRVAFRVGQEGEEWRGLCLFLRDKVDLMGGLSGSLHLISERGSYAK